MIWRVFAAAATSLAATSALAFTPYGPLQTFMVPGSASTVPWDVNDAGTIVGEFDDQGFVYSGGVFTAVAHPNGLPTSLTGLTADGATLVGNYFETTVAGTFTRGFVLSGGVFEAYDVPGSIGTTIRHISDNGRYFAGTFNDAAGTFHGFAYDRLTGARVDFLAEPNRNQIAQGVSDDGVVVGSFLRNNPAGGPTQAGAFVYDFTSGTRTEVMSVDGLGRPRFRDINAQGLVAGFAGSTAFVGDGSSWQTWASDDPAVVNVAAYGLNNVGTLVGYRLNLETGASVGWITTAVPEPAAWALWGLGLAGVAAARRRGSARG